MALKLSPKLFFLPICACLSKKPKSVKTMHLKVLITLFQKKIYKGLSHYS